MATNADPASSVHFDLSFSSNQTRDISRLSTDSHNHPDKSDYPLHLQNHPDTNDYPLHSHHRTDISGTPLNMEMDTTGNPLTTPSNSGTMSLNNSKLSDFNILIARLVRIKNENWGNKFHLIDEMILVIEGIRATDTLDPENTEKCILALCFVDIFLHGGHREISLHSLQPLTLLTSPS